MTPGKLQIDPVSGKVTGPASIQYNDPWPCPNGNAGVTTGMQGVIMHTMVSDLASCIATFNNTALQVSAHFGIAENGLIHQFFPMGKGYEAWHAMAANLTWYGVEHADAGHPDTPLTAQQMAASAQLLEVLSRFCGFPLQVTDSPAGRGYGTHSMGGVLWGGHTCPDVPPEHVRSLQRAGIVTMAKQIQNPPPPWQSLAKSYLTTASANALAAEKAMALALQLVDANQ